MVSEGLEPGRDVKNNTLRGTGNLKKLEEQPFEEAFEINSGHILDASDKVYIGESEKCLMAEKNKKRYCELDKRMVQRER